MLEVLDGSPVSEVAARYGVTRQSVYLWREKYLAGGMAALQERSSRPHTTPTRLAAETEAFICQLRREHPRWGARRIAYELGRDAKRRQKSPAVVGSGIRSGPTAFMYAVSWRSRSMSSSRVPPHITL